MTFTVNNVFVSPDFDFSKPELIKKATAKKLNIHAESISSCELLRRSIDARHKNDIKFCLSVKINTDCDLDNAKDTLPFIKKEYEFSRNTASSDIRPVVVGFGPSGMFAALTLSRAGLKPIVLERGQDVDSRINSVHDFWNGSPLSENSNVQFGEGGAGTFSDGKLNTGTKDVRNRAVLGVFYEYGADESILYDSKPHVGTDVLPKIVKGIRQEIINSGGEIHFSSKFTGFKQNDGKITAVLYENEKGETEVIITDTLLLCLGHSARDTFRYLYESGVKMEAKSFSLGARIEHKQSKINKALLGKFHNHKALIPADYKVFTHLDSDRGVYSFCMCPGGEVVNSSSEKGGIVTNGMSNFLRNGDNANSALLVSVNPDDVSGDNPLRLMELQRSIEQKAYIIGNGVAVSQLVGDFIKGAPSTQAKSVKPTFLPKVTFGNICDVLPKFVTDSIKEALPIFDKKINGFSCPDAVLTAPETRSSSPVKIIRNPDYSTDISGLYPVGEGAGYAGGIMSSAVDGIKAAEHIITRFT